jgi:hypothetical protein
MGDRIRPRVLSLTLQKAKIKMIIVEIKFVHIKKYVILTIFLETYFSIVCIVVQIKLRSLIFLRGFVRILMSLYTNAEIGL